jgi:hypothetical protein
MRPPRSSGCSRPCSSTPARVGNLLDREQPQLAFELVLLVDLEIQDRAAARLERLGHVIGSEFEKHGTGQQARGGIATHCLLELLRERFHVTALGRDLESHRGLAIEFEALEVDLERSRCAVRLQRIDLERSAGPAALQRRNESAFQGTMTVGIEKIHERLRDDRRDVGQPEQLEPGRIGIDDDTFLDMRDRVGRAGHERAHLVAVLAGRCQRAGKRSVETRKVQFALRDGGQPRLRAQRHHVARAAHDRGREVVFGQRVADQDDRHVRRMPITDVDDWRGILAIREAREHQPRMRLRERVAQTSQLTYPGAMHGMSSIAQRAVDQLARILMPRQHDDRNRCRFGQLQSPRRSPSWRRQTQNSVDLSTRHS